MFKTIQVLHGSWKLKVLFTYDYVLKFYAFEILNNQGVYAILRTHIMVELCMLHVGEISVIFQTNLLEKMLILKLLLLDLDVLIFLKSGMWSISIE